LRELTADFLFPYQAVSQPREGGLQSFLNLGTSLRNERLGPLPAGRMPISGGM
jgi:hypothetical protein